MSVDEIVDTALCDRMFYDATGGGVTFSGGECMLYPDFIREVASRLKKDGVHIAIDTAGLVPFESFEKVIPYTDVFLYDVKCIDERLHIEGTGRSNKKIIENLDRLISLGCNIIIRVPVIPGFNDTDELERIKEFIDNRGLYAEYLPFHEMGEGKKRAIDLGKSLRVKKNI